MDTTFMVRIRIKGDGPKDCLERLLDVLDRGGEEEVSAYTIDTYFDENGLKQHNAATLDRRTSSNHFK